MKEGAKRSLILQDSEVRLKEMASICQDKSVNTLAVEPDPRQVQVLHAELKDTYVDHLECKFWYVDPNNVGFQN